MIVCKKISYELFFGAAVRWTGSGLLAAITVVTLLFMGPPLTAHAEVVDRIVAIIDSHIITLSELNTAANMELDNAAGKEPTGETDLLKYRSKALENLINQKLVKQASDSAGIDVTDREIDSAIEEVKKQNNLTKKSLLLALAQSGLSMREYREQMKVQLREAKFVDMEFKSKILVLPEEVEDYYRQNIEEFLQPPTFRVRMILLPNSNKSVQKGRLKAINEGLEKNETFEELARQYSEGPAASKGGDLGWLSKGELDPTLETIIEKLKVGEVSQAITRPEGIYLLQLSRKRDAEPASMAESTPSIQKTLFNRRMEKRFSSWLKEARKYAHIEIRL